MHLTRRIAAQCALTVAAAFACQASLAQSAIEIGATVPMTGPAAASGTQYYNSLRLAEEDINRSGGINGKPLHINFEDAQSANPTALNAFVKLVQEKQPVFAFLTSYSTQVLAVAPEVTKSKIPVMYAGGADAISDLKNPLMFRIRPTDSAAATAIARFVKQDLKASKPGILYIQNDFGQGAMRAASKLLTDAGLTLAATEAYGGSDKDMSAQLLSLKNKGADVIIALTYPQDGALILHQIKALGMKQPVVASSAAFLPSALALVSPSDLENVWGVIDALIDGTGPSEKFAKDYKAKFKVDADAYAATYYDGAMVVANALRKVGPDPEKLRQEIANTKDYKGVCGTLSFDAEGNGVHQVTVVNFKKGTKDMVFVTKVSAGS